MIVMSLIHLMTSLQLFSVLILMSLVFSGCSLTKEKPKVQHYALALPSSTSDPSSPPLKNTSLVVRSFTAQQPYNRDRIVYRSSPYAFDFYHYHRWVTKPTDMITALTRRSLQQSNLFQTVYPTATARADMQLGGVIRQCEEVDQAQSWQAALTIDIWLTRARESAPFWFQTYTATQQASKRNPAAVAEAMSRNLQDILTRLSQDLEAELAKTSAP